MTGALRIGTEVAETLAAGRPVVALETSVIGQGLPHPRNVECLERMSGAIRAAGAVPAWVGVLGGEVVVGLSDMELEPFHEPGRSEKVARRDLPAACARGGPGATTVSATIGPPRAPGSPSPRPGGSVGAPGRPSRRERGPRGAGTHAGPARVQRPEVDRGPGGDRGAPGGARGEPRRLPGGPAPRSSWLGRPRSRWSIAWTRRPRPPGSRRRRGSWTRPRRSCSATRCRRATRWTRRRWPRPWRPPRRRSRAPASPDAIGRPRCSPPSRRRRVADPRGEPGATRRERRARRRRGDRPSGRATAVSRSPEEARTLRGDGPTRPDEHREPPEQTYGQRDEHATASAQGHAEAAGDEPPEGEHRGPDRGGDRDDRERGEPRQDDRPPEPDDEQGRDRGDGEPHELAGLARRREPDLQRGRRRRSCEQLPPGPSRRPPAAVGRCRPRGTRRPSRRATWRRDAHGRSPDRPRSSRARPARRGTARPAG